MITRTLLLLLAILILIWLIKRQFTSSQDARPHIDSKVGDLVVCVYCKVHVLKKLGFESQGHFYCSRAHAKLHKAEQNK